MNKATHMKMLKTFSYSIIAAIALICSFNAQTFAETVTADSTIISIDKRNQTLLNQKNNKTLRENLQELFTKSGMSLDDDTWRGIRRIVNSDLNNDTLLVITQDSKSIKVVINTDSKNGTNNDEKTSDREKQNNGVTLDKNGIVVKSGVKHEVRISTNGVYVNDGGEETKIVLRDTSNVKRRDRSFNSRSGFNVYFGLNSFTNTGSIASVDSKNYELSPFGSRYFGFGWTRSGTVSKSDKAAFKISYGLEFSWYNFMFENNNFIIKGNEKVEFQNYPDNNKNPIVPIELSRNKITIANINIPVMPYIAFKSGSIVTYVAAGGYVGYRLDSYTKTKEEDSGKKQWNHSSFFLNNFRYGLAFELGLKDFPDLFINYDMNNLFQDGRGPKVGGLSFGIRL